MTSLLRYENGRSRAPVRFDWEPLRLLDDLFFSAAYSAEPRVRETDEAIAISVDLPGVDRRDIDITLDPRTLTIVGARGNQIYRYAVTVGSAIDPDRIEAELDKGVLTVHAYKRDSAKPRRIAINAKPRPSIREHSDPEPGPMKRLLSRLRLPHRK